VFAYGQASENAKLIELGKAYKNFMFKNEPGKDILKEINSDVPQDLKKVTDFIVQTISTDNRLLTNSYLTLPDETTIKIIYIVRAINLNIREENQIDNYKLIDSLRTKSIPRYELVDNYYSLLFTAVGNKIKPFNFSKIDFKMKNYNLADDTEKGIFFLRCMDYCGTSIWGYMNIVKPANLGKAYEYIKKYPRFDSQPYYQFSDLYFPDFEMKILKAKGPQSYKGYYINKYYEVLLSHLICLNKEGGSQKEKNNLLLGSILKERNLYKYTKYKETLEDIFKEQKTE
jgi:hypothetical protein